MITTVQCSICSQLNNKPRVVVTDFMLHHTIDNIHGTGLETCHVSALNACKTKRPLHVTGIRTSQVSERCCLYISSMAFYIRKIEAAIVGPYWRNLVSMRTVSTWMKSTCLILLE